MKSTREQQKRRRPELADWFLIVVGVLVLFAVKECVGK